MYRGPQEDIQNRLAIEPNNGNPRGANNMPANDPYGYLPGDPRNARGQSQNPRYTAPTVDASGRVTNSNLQNFALPTFNYRELMGLQPGFNPMDYLRNLFQGPTSMITPGERPDSRLQQIRDLAIGIGRGGAPSQDDPRLKPAVMPPQSDGNLSKPAQETSSQNPLRNLLNLSRGPKPAYNQGGSMGGDGAKPIGVMPERAPAPQGGVVDDPTTLAPEFDPYSFLSRFRRSNYMNRMRGGG